VWTVRKWRRRALRQGRVGLASQMGRPATGTMSTFSPELREALLHLRTLHPGWGPATLLVALKTDSSFRDQPLPSRARMAKLLKHAGLTRRYQHQHDLIQPPRAPLISPHQEWQMDAQGQGFGPLSPLPIKNGMGNVVGSTENEEVYHFTRRPIISEKGLPRQALS
jgi:hypothetical protein